MPLSMHCARAVIRTLMCSRDLWYFSRLSPSKSGGRRPLRSAGTPEFLPEIYSEEATIFDYIRPCGDRLIKYHQSQVLSIGLGILDVSVSLPINRISGGGARLPLGCRGCSLSCPTVNGSRGREGFPLINRLVHLNCPCRPGRASVDPL